MVHRRPKGRAATRHNSHSDSRARASNNDNERSQRGNPFDPFDPFDLGSDFVFAPNDLAASKRGTLGYASTDVLVRYDTIETHSDMLIRFENKCNSNPPFSVPPSRVRAPRHPWFVSHSPGRAVVSRATFIAGRTWRNYPAAKSAPPTRIPHARVCVCVCMCVCVCVCARASCTTRPCPPHGRRDHLKKQKRGKKMMRCARETETVESFQRERERLSVSLSSLSSTTTIHF